MADLRHEVLLRVETGDGLNHDMVCEQKRMPFWHEPGNGYRYGPGVHSSGSVSTIEVRSWRGGLGIHTRSADGQQWSSDSLRLGNISNGIDLYLFGVPEPVLLTPGGTVAPNMRLEEGEFTHRLHGEFSRKASIPIFAGELTLHLADAERFANKEVLPVAV